MASVLADNNLRIIGYPAHICLLPGEFHNPTSKSKAIGGLTREEISALVEALKVGAMFIEKVPLASRGESGYARLATLD
jgi:hypothetical protein